MKNILKVLLILFLIIKYSGVFSQTSHIEGTEFWLGFLENESNNKLAIAISSSNATSGTISIPGMNWTTSFILTTGGKIEIDIPSHLANVIGKGKASKGIYIQSKDPISVMAINRTGTNDEAAFIYPTQQLGDHYLINMYAWNAYQLFMIVATEDNTIIDITTTDSSPFTITLNKGEIYQHKTNDVTHFLAQSEIKVSCSNGSKNKIAVFNGAVCSYYGNCNGCNHLYEQVVCTDLWGKEFIAAPAKTKEAAQYNVMASEDNTTVVINGNPTLIHKKHIIPWHYTGPFYVSADKPVSVVQLTTGQGCGSKGDPFMNTIPPVEQGLKEATFVTFTNSSKSESQSNYINIVTAQSNKSNIFINGENINASNFITLPINPFYCYAQIELGKESNYYKITSQGFFNAYVYGLNNENAYAYPIGFNKGLKDSIQVRCSFNTNATGNCDTACSCESVQFIAPTYPDGTIYTWDFDNGKSIQNKIVTENFLNGQYDIKLFIKNENLCISDTLTHHLIIQNCDISINPSSYICKGESATLTVNSGTNFIWSTMETTKSISVKPDQTTLYYVTVDNGTTHICDSIIVYVKEKPSIKLPENVTICNKDTIVLTATSPESNYLWQDNTKADTYKASKEGKYWVRVSNQCGTDSDTTKVNVIYPPESNLTDQLICVGDVIELCDTIPGDNIVWDNGQLDSCRTFNSSGTYWIKKNNECFTSTKNIHIDYKICKELFIPNLITPDNDLFNEYFKIIGIEERNCSIEIYNRWGELVYRKEKYNNDWKADGMADGIYYYHLNDHTTDTVFKGWLQVVK